MENEKKRWETEIEQRASSILPVNFLTVNVSLEPSRLFDEVSRIYVMEAERVTRFTSNDNLAISEEEFSNYFKTLLFLRVSRANGTESNVTRAYKHDVRGYQVPAFVHTLINSVGLATDRDFGIKFVPQCNLDAEELLGPSDMRDISMKLGVLSQEGLVCVDTGVSMRPEGELSLMAMLNVEGEVLSYKKDHPVYGFYASFFKHKILDDMLNPSLFRVRYGSEDEYASYVRFVV